MRMSDNPVPRLAGLKAVDPTTVSGRVKIGNDTFLYAHGVLNFGGKKYLVSDDHDFVITHTGLAVGAIVNGALIHLAKLDSQTRAMVRTKYKV